MPKRTWLWLAPLTAGGITLVAAVVAIALVRDDDGNEVSAPPPATTTRHTTPPTTTATAPTTTTRRQTTRRRTTTTTTATTEEVVVRGMVPSLLGLTEDLAVAQIDEAGYKARVTRERSFQPDGVVFEQEPDPGTELEEGESVSITVSVFKVRRPPPQESSDAPRLATVPRVVGQRHSEAGDQVEGLGLIANTFPVPSNRPGGLVIAQSPAPGARLRRGSPVRLNVALGEGTRPAFGVPRTSGLSELTAHFRCRTAGFTCLTVYVQSSRVGRVVRQSPRAGRQAEALTQMKLYVGR